MAPLKQWPADPNGNQLTTKATDINGHNGDCTVMKLGIPLPRSAWDRTSKWTAFPLP